MDTESNTVIYEKPIVKEEAPVQGTALQYELYYPPHQTAVIIPQHQQQI
jgi:hypothetical protein